MYGQEKEIQGIKDNLDLLINKKNFFLQKLTKTSDVGTEFSLLEEIKDLEKKIEAQREELVRFTPNVLRIDDSFIRSLEGEMPEPDIKGFYLAHQENYLQFRGLINGLGAKQIGEDAFFEKLQNSFQNSTKKIIGQVIGSGGIGKTTFLRQIALRWVRQTGKPVFWLSENDYENLDINILAEQLPTDALLIGDEAERNAEILKKLFAKMPQHRFVSTSRKFPKNLANDANANEYDMDKVDLLVLNSNILDTLAKHLPISQHLKNEAITNIKPFPLLFVLLRSLEAGKNLSLIEDVARTFSDIIQDDLELLKVSHLAQALRTFAYIFKKYQFNITNLAFADLAPEAHIADEPAKTDTILAYYLGVFVNEKDKSQKIKETQWTFHKDDLAEEIEKHLSLQQKLACEKQTEELLASKNERTASNILWLWGRQKQDKITFLRTEVGNLLQAQNTHHAYMQLVTHKNNYLQLTEIGRWNYIEQFLAFESQNNSFNLLIFSKQSKSAFAKEKAKAFLKKDNQSNEVLCTCLNLLGIEAKQEAKELLKKDNQSNEVLCACLNLLGTDAKQEAKELLTKENQSSNVLCACLNLLGIEAKREAKELLKKQNQSNEVLCACLNLLGKTTETEIKAKELLAVENQDKQVLSVCLNLLGKTPETEIKAKELLKVVNQRFDVLCACLNLLDIEAKQEAKELLKKDNQSNEVLCACLNLLGIEAKQEAKELLKKENQSSYVLCTCLKLLGTEAKQDAKELLKKQNQHQFVLGACLKLLGNEAKEEAKLLLKTNQDKEVLCVCLNLLGIEAKEEAKLLLKKENQSSDILCTCLKLLGSEAKDEAKLFLKKENQNPNVLCVCLNILGKIPETEVFAQRMLGNWQKTNFQVLMHVLTTFPERKEYLDIVAYFVKNRQKFGEYSRILYSSFPESKVWEQRVRYILTNWQTQNPLLVNNCLSSYAYNIDFTKPICEEILHNWNLGLLKSREGKKTSIAYILKAFAHPLLKKLAEEKAKEVLKQGKEYVGDGFYAIAEKIVNENKYPEWNTKPE